MATEEMPSAIEKTEEPWPPGPFTEERIEEGPIIEEISGPSIESQYTKKKVQNNNTEVPSIPVPLSTTTTKDLEVLDIQAINKLVKINQRTRIQTLSRDDDTRDELKLEPGPNTKIMYTAVPPPPQSPKLRPEHVQPFVHPGIQMIPENTLNVLLPRGMSQRQFI